MADFGKLNSTLLDFSDPSEAIEIFGIIGEELMIDFFSTLSVSIKLVRNIIWINID